MAAQQETNGGLLGNYFYNLVGRKELVEFLSFGNARNRRRRHLTYPAMRNIAREILFSHYDKRVNVVLCSLPLPGYDNSVPHRYLESLNDPNLRHKPRTPEAERFWDGVVLLAQTLCQPIFTELGDSEETRSRDLQTYTRPETINLQLVSVDGSTELIRRDDVPPPRLHPPISDPTKFGGDLPTFFARSLEVIRVIGLPWELSVLAQGQMMFCRLTSYDDEIFLLRDYHTLLHIKNAGLSPQPRVPNLRGIVKLDNGDIVGILTDFSPSSGRTPYLSLDTAMNLEDTTQAQKGKWMAQIEEAVRQLHSIGVVWGSPSKSNVVVDEKDDAWLFDFSGQHVYDFLEKDGLCDTQEGDLRGLDMIRKELGL